MRDWEVTEALLTPGAQLLEKEEGAVTLCLSPQGGGMYLPEFAAGRERYLVFRMEAREQHSVAMNLLIYGKEEEKAVMTIRFGILPEVDTLICIDRKWLDGHVLFPEAVPGQLKIVCHGSRIEQEEITRVELVSLPSFHPVTVTVSKLQLTDEYPQEPSLKKEKLVDCFGQNAKKEWTGKTKSLEDMKEALEKQAAGEGKGYPFEDWSVYGGFKGKRLGEGTGYFTRCRADGRWWLVDPLGYAYFSLGPDCVGLGTDCRVDGVEQWLEWLPNRDDSRYQDMFAEIKKREDGEQRRKGLLFSYARANLYRTFGENWYEIWRKMIIGQLKHYGMNTLGNWSDAGLFGNMEMPYVTSLPEFPSTKLNIFRDFPDVFSEEYQESARRCAGALEERKGDPLMIGYFLRNEPGWAFVDHLVLADEVLYNPHRTVCKERLIAFLKERYGQIEILNREWKHSFDSFEDLYRPLKKVSEWSGTACSDMREFSREMLRAYVEIPVRECRKVDPDHMILGMRWAWISDPDIVTGWENFDVFSINCYAVDPAQAIQRVVDLGVDLPVMIGEFHFGALDAGPSATGLEGVESQRDRGTAYRYYCEHAAAHPYGVGCHYFQCYDQFVLGRFDGENYNIGLFDVCSRPYEEMLEQVRQCSGRIYRVAEGTLAPVSQKAQTIPMIAY